jgi:hypothetical protein
VRRVEHVGKIRLQQLDWLAIVQPKTSPEAMSLGGPRSRRASCVCAMTHSDREG